MCLLQEPGVDWWRDPAPGRDQGRGSQSIRRPAVARRKHPEDVPAAEWPGPARAHVPHTTALRLLLPADDTEHRRHGAHPAHCRRLQDEAGVTHPRC